MAKDDRIVVRMSSELKEWVHAQASSREMDDAAFVRMVLAEARSGAAVPKPIAQPAAPIQRDVLDVASPAEPYAEETTEQSEAPLIDIDAMVAATVAEAEEAGLTQAQIEQAQGDMPHAGVRPLMRRPIPFSRGTQSARLEQMFGGN